MLKNQVMSSDSWSSLPLVVLPSWAQHKQEGTIQYLFFTATLLSIKHIVCLYKHSYKRLHCIMMQMEVKEGVEHEISKRALYLLFTTTLLSIKHIVCMHMCHGVTWMGQLWAAGRYAGGKELSDRLAGIRA